MQPAVNSGENYSCEECGIPQFPFWDFFECNTTIFLPLSVLDATGSLNSLCGISLNATWTKPALHLPRLRLRVSQFPLWDFFECNGEYAYTEYGALTNAISQFPLWDFFECNSYGQKQ
jgi:hypothetical protein